MPLRIYDTLTREKREFVPVTRGQVGMYGQNIGSRFARRAERLGHERREYATHNRRAILP